MVLITCTILMTIIVLNVHFRSPATHTMSPFTRRVFLELLPRLLCMQRPPQAPQSHSATRQQQQLRSAVNTDSPIFSDGVRTHVLEGPNFDRTYAENRAAYKNRRLNPDVKQAMIGVRFIAEYLERQNESNKVILNFIIKALVKFV